MSRSTDYRPRAGRTIIEALTRHDIAQREAARRRAAQHADVIAAVRVLRCPADRRFTHLLNNDLICARCDETAATILERTSR